MKELLLVLSLVIFSSCTTSSIKDEVESEAKMVKHTQSISKRMRENRKTIQDSKNLTKEQKDALLKLQDETFAKAQTYKIKLNDLKEVLFKNFASNKFDDAKIDYIAKKIAKLNKERMKLMFSSLRKAKKILRGTDDDAIHRALFIFDHPLIY